MIFESTFVTAVPPDVRKASGLPDLREILWAMP
jgi:hypothetical protein